MTTPSRIDPVDWGDLFELCHRQTTEADLIAGLLEITRMIQQCERESAAEKNAK